MRRKCVLAVCIGISAATLFGVAPAGAAEEERPEPAGQTTTCRDVLDAESGHEVDQTTAPPDGAEVRPGDAVEVRIAWQSADFNPGEAMWDVLSCVTVGGVLDETLSAHVEDTPNVGEFTHRFTVPASVPAGTKVCTRAAVAGNGNGYFERNVTTDECLSSLEVLAPAAQEAPPVVRGITTVADERQPEAAAPVLQAALPRTGSRQQLPLALAGVLMAIGGALVGIRPSGRRG